MSNSTILSDKSYTLFLSSADKVSGTNNSANFNVNWDSFLPREYSIYKVTFSFQSGGGNYKDTQFTAVSTNGVLTCATILNGLLTFTTANMNAAGFTPTGKAGIYIGQQITGTGITNLILQDTEQGRDHRHQETQHILSQITVKI